MSAPGTLEVAGSALARLLLPLGDALSSPEAARALMTDLGVDLPESFFLQPATVSALTGVTDRVGELPAHLTALADAIADDDLAGMVAAGQEVVATAQAVIGAIDAVATQVATASAAIGGLDPADLSAFADELPERLVEHLAVRYLETEHRTVLGALYVVGVADREVERPDSTDPRRPATYRHRLRLDRVPKLLEDPTAALADLYGWGGGVLDADRLLFGLDALLEALGVLSVVDDSGDVPVLRTVGTEVRPRNDVAGGALEATFAFGTGSAFSADVALADGWSLHVELGAEVDAGAVVTVTPPLDIDVRPTALPVTGTAGVELVRTNGADGPPVIFLGMAGGPRIEADAVALGVGTELTWDAVQGRAAAAFEASLALRGGRVVIALGGADGFLRGLFGDDVVVDLETEVGWTAADGLYFAGGAGTDVTLPVDVMLGPVRVTALYLSLEFADGAIRIEAAAAIGARLGPFAVAVDRMGIAAALSFPDGGGNLGMADLELAFKPPSGVALSIDAGAVVGGGFLSFDPTNEQYAGAMHLEVEGGLALNAFGLLTTRMPDGSPGFSLLILVQASGFAPVPLGFGFTLTGVGGLLGVNRTVDVEVLRAGIRSRVLDSILFCNDDPAPRAAQIVSTLNSVFPPARDRYVFGPMVQLEWGTPTLVTIEVALLLELPSPLRLIVLGRLHALLPVAEAAIVTLHLDAVGVLDFGRREASVDATLYDSSVGPFSLSGDMALRVSWGEQPEFALAIGGFHPAFKPPAGFPALRRLTLVLATGENPRVRAEVYLAVTANTIQLGARLELRAEASGFVLEGGMGFDTLLTRVPFGFEVDIAAYLALKRGGSTIMGIDLRANLAGPNPWHLRGSVSFSILFLSVTIPIDATFGDTRQLPEVQREPVWPELKEALEAPGNWAAELPADAGRLAVLSPAPAGAGEVVVHPLGAVRVLQRVVPLERTIARFGAAPPQDYSRFSISEVVGAHRDSVVYDSFAPAQFLEMTDADKLSAPGFERMPAGVRLRAPEDASAFGSAASRPLRYETIAIGGPAAGTRFEPDAATIAQQAERGAAAGAATRTTGRAKFSVETPPPRVAEPAFEVTDVTDLTPKPELTDGTYSAALEAAGLHRDVQIVRRAELAVP